MQRADRLVGIRGAVKAASGGYIEYLIEIYGDILRFVSVYRYGNDWSAVMPERAVYVDSRKLGKSCDQHIRKLSVACVYLFDAFFHDESYSFAKTCDARDVERAAFVFVGSVFRLMEHL